MLPLLAAMAVPRAWSALTIARHRYVSWHRFVQHARASQLISRLVIDQQAAADDEWAQLASAQLPGVRATLAQLSK
ncbi:hypothetical protein [Streptomyces sp. NPDC058542]|uniref:hypothetical protein n=1 Tax=Streptomyces sp. NPDC058542 TaxID=3346543 RepID=UPI00365CE313